MGIINRANAHAWSRYSPQRTERIQPKKGSVNSNEDTTGDPSTLHSRALGYDGQPTSALAPESVQSAKQADCPRRGRTRGSCLTVYGWLC